MQCGCITFRFVTDFVIRESGVWLGIGEEKIKRHPIAVCKHIIFNIHLDFYFRFCNFALLRFGRHSINSHIFVCVCRNSINLFSQYCYVRIPQSMFVAPLVWLIDNRGMCFSNTLPHQLHSALTIASCVDNYFHSINICVCHLLMTRCCTSGVSVGFIFHGINHIHLSNWQFWFWFLFLS